MIMFPNAKINIGLNVLRKRLDGFHDLETIFYPLQLCDILEINISEVFHFKQTGIQIDGSPEQNLVVKAFRMLQNDFSLCEVNIHLHKQIPFGAGLGGGSSDAAHTLIGINELFKIGLSQTQLIEYAAKLGSDCPFFILNKPAFASGRGEVLRPIDMDIKGYTLVLVKPNCSVSTANAYAQVVSAIPSSHLNELIHLPVSTWKGLVVNQFEQSVFPTYPEIEQIKNRLYEMGAVYASMSGSGSAVFGLFDDPFHFKEEFKDIYRWQEQCRG